MSVASELNTSLRSMGFVQLLAAIVFLAAYTVACSALFDTRGRLRASGLAVLAGVVFTAFTQPWVHGVLLLAGCVGGVGLFSLAVWSMSSALSLRQTKPLFATDVPVLNDAVALPAMPTPPLHTPHHDGVPAA